MFLVMSNALHFFIYKRLLLSCVIVTDVFFLHTSNIDLTVKIDQMEIKGSEKENLLGVLIDKRLTFEPHVKRLCNKVSQK